MLFLALWLPLSSPVFADSDEAGPPPADVQPLDRLLARLRAEFPGRVLKVELEYEDDDGAGWIYEIKLLTPQGHVLKLDYDARTLELRELKGRTRERRRGRDHDDD